MRGKKPEQRYLLQIYKLDRIIENKLAEAAQWKAIATNTTQQMGGERVQSSGSQQRMADAMNRYIDIQREIDEHIDRMIETKREIISTIEQLDALEYDVLHKVYVQGKSLQDVADMLDRSYSRITTIHGNALSNLRRILEARKQDV